MHEPSEDERPQIHVVHLWFDETGEADTYKDTQSGSSVLVRQDSAVFKLVLFCVCAHARGCWMVEVKDGVLCDPHTRVTAVADV